MKSITRLLLVVMTAALLVACQSKEADATLEPSPFEWIPSSQDGVELTMSTDTIDSDVDTLTFTIRNGGDEAIELLINLMGEKVEARKNFIFKNIDYREIRE